MQSKDERIHPENIKYLSDRVYGRPVQTIQGNPDRPVVIQLAWGAPTPDWLTAEAVQVDLEENPQVTDGKTSL